MSFTIARLVPEILGLNGSSQNASLIASYLKHAGHEVTIIDVHSLETAPLRVDAVCVGMGLLLVSARQPPHSSRWCAFLNCGANMAPGWWQWEPVGTFWGTL